MQLSGINYIHIDEQPPPPSTCRTFSSSQTETLSPLSNSSPFSLAQHLATTILLSISMNLTTLLYLRSSQVALVVIPPASAGDIRDVDSIPGSGRSPGAGHGNPFQYSCLESPVDKRSLTGYTPWVTKSRTQLKRLSALGAHTYTHTCLLASLLSYKELRN